MEDKSNTNLIYKKNQTFKSFVSLTYTAYEKLSNNWIVFMA